MRFRLTVPRAQQCSSEFFYSGPVAAFFAFLLFVASFPADAEDDWRSHGVTENGVVYVNAVEAAALLRDRPQTVVLDVRTGLEYNQGHLSDAVNINYYSFSFSRQLARLDPEKVYLLHCKVGVRSSKSIALMKKAGLHNIVHLDGGIDAWLAAGLPTVK